MSLPTTYLFVPGNRPDRFEKALVSGADVVILDLEDAVAAGDKALAREAVHHWCVAHPEILDRIAVRINGTDSNEHSLDVDSVAHAGVPQVMLPKAESAEAVVDLTNKFRSSTRILPLIESARGVEAVYAIAAAPGVLRLAFGTLDYALDLGMQADSAGNSAGDAVGMVYPASRIAIASRCLYLAPPIAGVTPDVGDDAALLADLRFARALGFGAKLCIHPRQVSRVHDALQPTADEVMWATRILAAAEDSSGATTLDGKMVDRPVIARAQAIIDRFDVAQREVRKKA